ncbi:MAG: hypothetical protein R3B40_20895 [Polyangiales bacterium]
MHSWLMPVRASLVSALLVLSIGCGRLAFQTVEGRDAGTDQGDPGSDLGPDDAGGEPDAGVTGFALGCSFPSITVILDGDANDTQAGTTMASAVASGCMQSPAISMVDQTQAGLLDPTTFAPLFGATTLGVLGGDSLVQNVMQYLTMSSAPVRATFPAGRYVVTERAGGTVVLDVAIGDISTSHDYGVVQIIRDTPSNSTVVAAHGYIAQGTLAAAHYFATVIAPSLPAETRAYFVLEWTDGNADTIPNAGDTFTLLADGA